MSVARLLFDLVVVLVHVYTRSPWTELLAGDEVLATAILDRLLGHQNSRRLQLQAAPR